MSSEPWTPGPHQERGIKHLISHAGGGLFFKPGLGKTSTVLAAYKVLLHKKFVKRMIILAPKRVAQHVWTAEAQKWTDFNDLRLVVLHGKDKDKRLHQDADIYLLNYEGLPWFLERNGFEVINPEILTADELTRLKNGKGKRFRMLRPHLNDFLYRWGLTGTPVPNGLIDLWGQMYIMDSGAALGRYVSHYRTEFFYPSGYGGYTWTLQEGAAEKIYERIKPYALYLEADDYVKMPRMLVNDIPVELPPEALTLYGQLYDDFIAVVGDTTFVAANTGAAGVKCRQVCNGALYDGIEDKSWTLIHDAKLEALDDLLEEISREPALVLYEFKHDAERIQHLLGSERCQLIGHGISEEKERALIKRFNLGDLEVMLAHPGSAGFGLNLQEAARHVIFFGLTWNLEHYEQAIDRILRQGNPHDVVVVHRILANTPLERRVARVIGSKDLTQRKFLKAMLTD